MVVSEMVGVLKRRYNAIDLVAGNIPTAVARDTLRNVGADAVKVGIHPGSIYTTQV